MNKYINSDFYHGLQYLKVGIHNIVNPIFKGEAPEYLLETDITPLMLYSILERNFPQFEMTLSDSAIHLGDIIVDIVPNGFLFHK